MAVLQPARISRDAQPIRAEYPWPWTGYSRKPAEMPLAGYAALLMAYGGLFGAVLSALSWRRPRTPRASDIAMFGIATHKIGRIITKDWVTSPVRAPFVEYVESAGGGEVKERSRGTGLRRAIGDLVTCPWCIAPWVAGTLYSFFLISPSAARLVSAGFTSVAISDFLQHAYEAARRHETDRREHDKPTSSSPNVTPTAS